MKRPPHSPVSDVLTIIFVIGVCIGAAGFLYALFGPLFVVGVVVFAVLGLVGALHYLVWGRSLQQGDPPTADTDSE